MRGEALGREVICSGVAWLFDDRAWIRTKGSKPGAFTRLFYLPRSFSLGKHVGLKGRIKEWTTLVGTLRGEEGSTSSSEARVSLPRLQAPPGGHCRKCPANCVFLCSLLLASGCSLLMFVTFPSSCWSTSGAYWNNENIGNWEIFVCGGRSLKFKYP